MRALRAFTSAMLLIAGVAVMPARADDPLPKLIERKVGASLCFARDYDAAHLRRNPAQTVTAVLMSLRYERDDAPPTLRARLTRRGARAPLYVVGGCEWSAEANRDTSGNPLIRRYPKLAGVLCMAITGPESDEEGGEFLIDLPTDGRTLMLYFDPQVAAWSGPDQSRNAPRVNLGREDQVFRLNRTEAQQCRELETAVRGH
ncbi:MAG TPA: hypothetical protein VHG27_00650 [Xanthobacteraceae bacterium]|nr:hypothetical protein [Xanthobacteraceae bacterium]